MTTSMARDPLQAAAKIAFVNLQSGFRCAVRADKSGGSCLETKKDSLGFQAYSGLSLPWPRGATPETGDVTNPLSIREQWLRARPFGRGLFTLRKGHNMKPDMDLIGAFSPASPSARSMARTAMMVIKSQRRSRNTSRAFGTRCLL